MEDSLNRNYVNISDRPFENKVYNDPDKNYFSYKPTNALWLSLESKKDGCFSKWDEEYGVFDEGKNRYANVVKFKPTTFIFSPSIDETLLEGFQNFCEKKDLTPNQKRQMFRDLVASRKNMSEIENVVCQIDVLEDLTTLERIFGNYQFGKEHPDSVYQNLAPNVKKGMRECFSGIEVTGYALGLDGECCEEGIDDVQAYWSSQDPKYDEYIGYFEIPSVAIFDTSCLDVVKIIDIPKEKEKNEREID